jgi:hypothetical protein
MILFIRKVQNILSKLEYVFRLKFICSGEYFQLSLLARFGLFYNYCAKLFSERIILIKPFVAIAGLMSIQARKYKYRMQDPAH